MSRDQCPCNIHPVWFHLRKTRSREILYLAHHLNWIKIPGSPQETPPSKILLTIPNLLKLYPLVRPRGTIPSKVSIPKQIADQLHTLSEIPELKDATSTSAFCGALISLAHIAETHIPGKYIPQEADRLQELLRDSPLPQDFSIQTPTECANAKRLLKRLKFKLEYARPPRKTRIESEMFMVYQQILLFQPEENQAFQNTVKLLRNPLGFQINKDTLLPEDWKKILETTYRNLLIPDIRPEQTEEILPLFPYPNQPLKAIKLLFPGMHTDPKLTGTIQTTLQEEPDIPPKSQVQEEKPEPPTPPQLALPPTDPTDESGSYENDPDYANDPDFPDEPDHIPVTLAPQSNPAPDPIPQDDFYNKIESGLATEQIIQALIALAKTEEKEAAEAAIKKVRLDWLEKIQDPLFVRCFLEDYAEKLQTNWKPSKVPGE